MSEQKPIMLLDELQEIRCRRLELEKYYERSARIRSQLEKVTTTPRIGSASTAEQDRMSAGIAKLEAVDEWLTVQIADYEARTQEVEAEVNKLPRYFRLVLRMYYIEGMRWQDVALTMGYAESHVKKIAGYARERIKDITLTGYTMIP